jgi:cobalt-zinc-cadmium resistance protein CzcA
MSLALWLLRNRFLVLIITGLLAAGGVLAWLRLPVDAFPDVTGNQVMILSKAPGLAAVDVEEQVSHPIEQVMRGLPRVEQVRSLSRAGLSQVVIVFEDGADTYWSRQVVFERLASVRSQLPRGVEPELGPISTGLGEIFQYTLEGGPAADPTELRSIHDWLVAPRLKPVRGVNEVNSFGGRVKQYHVLVSPEKLVEYGLTVTDVVEAIERNNANAGGGVLVRDWEQVYLRGVGLLRDAADIERIVLKAERGAPVYLRDVAEVEVGSEPRQGAVSRDGRGEVVAGMIIMLKGENSKEVVSRVKTAIDKVRESLPPGVRLSVFYDRTSLIEACIRTVTDALLGGGVLVILVLFLFVAELRTALIVVFSLPFTFLCSFIVMGAAGLSSNLMSLGGLAFSVGMVVDASIVVVENVRRHLARRTGTDRLQVVAEALLEVWRPVAFSILIIALILVPLFALQGIEGKMFAPLAMTMLIALLVSLLVALTAVPVLAAQLLPQAPERTFGFIRRFQAGYLRLLAGAIRRPLLTLSLSVAVLFGAALLLPVVGTEFMPPLDEGSIAVNVVRLPNASLEGSLRVADFMERRLQRFPEVETVVSKTGRAEISEDPMGPEQTDLLIMLKERRRWKTGRSKAELVEAMQRDLAAIPGLRLSFSQPIALRVNELISGVKSDLAVKIFGSDLGALEQLANRIAAAVRQVDGACDVKVEQVAGMTQLDAQIDREAVARHGINVADVNATIEAAVAGQKATTLIEGQRRTPVVVRFPEPARADQGAVERLLVPAPGGERVPLGELAQLRLVEGIAQVSRENGMRRVVVESNVRGRDLGSFVEEVRGRIAPLLRELPAGSFVEYGGQFENQQRAMKKLALVVPVALLLVVLLLYLALGSLRSSLLVLLNLPFALVGGLVADAARQLRAQVEARTGGPFADTYRQDALTHGPTRVDVQFEGYPGIEWDQDHYRGDAYPAYSWAAAVAFVGRAAALLSGGGVVGVRLVPAGSMAEPHKTVALDLLKAPFKGK